jgi:predicted membrane protein
MLDSTHLFVWEEFAAAKRGKISVIRTFKTESFNMGFYLSFIVMFDVNCFAHACIISLADCRRWAVSQMCMCIIALTIKCLPNMGLIGQAWRVFHSMSIHNMKWLHGVPKLWDVWAMAEGVGTI